MKGHILAEGNAHGNVWGGKKFLHLTFQSLWVGVTRNFCK